MQRAPSQDDWAGLFCVAGIAQQKRLHSPLWKPHRRIVTQQSAGSNEFVVVLHTDGVR